jgi:RHS repeat-associated protein
VGSRTFLRAGAGVTASVLDDGNAVYTPGVSELHSGTTTYSHSGLKHMAAQSGQSGSVAASREYDAFGGVASSSGSWQGPFGAAGAFGYQTEASGLHLLGHRYYDPTLGRFLTRDPIGDGSNWYAYCGNDPIACADPSGLLFAPTVAAAMLADGRARNRGYFTAPYRVRMVVAPPGFAGYTFGHAWVEIEGPDETIDLYEHLPGGNVRQGPLPKEAMLVEGRVDGVYYRELTTPKPKFRPKEGSYPYLYATCNCVSFVRILWREYGGDGINWWRHYPRPKPGLVPGSPTPYALLNDYDGWKKR